MAEPDSLQGLANALGNADIAGDAFHMSRATFQIIIDELQRLNKNGDDHDQVIHELRSEISSLKPQVQGLQEENAALKREIEILRVQQPEASSCAPSATEQVTGVHTRSMSRSSSLSYVSPPGSPPETRPQAPKSSPNDEAPPIEEDSTEVATAINFVLDAMLNSLQASPPRRTGLRKRKAPAQPDADWKPSQAHKAKKPRRAREESQLSEPEAKLPSPTRKGDPARLKASGSQAPVAQKMDIDDDPPRPLDAKASNCHFVLPTRV